MDSKLVKLSEFSTALTDVLASLDKKVSVLDSAGANANTTADFLELAEHVKQHDDTLKSLENGQLKQRIDLEESINTHATTSKAIMETTTRHCAELQQGLSELRSTSSEELSSLQGSLEVSLRKSIFKLAEFMQPNTRSVIPIITADMTSQEVVATLLSRIEQLELSSRDQEVSRKLKEYSVVPSPTDSEGGAVTNPAKLEELYSRLARSERKCEKQEKSMREFERRMTILANSQSRSLKMINAISQKVNAIASVSWDKTSEDGSKKQGVSFNEILERKVSKDVVEDHTLVAVEVFREAQQESEREGPAEEGLTRVMMGRQDGPLVKQTKELIRQKSQQAAEQSRPTVEVPVVAVKDVPPAELVDSGTMTMTFPSLDEDSSQVTLDSSVMVEEFVLEKIDMLERKVEELIASKQSARGDETPENPTGVVRALRQGSFGDKTSVSGSVLAMSSNPVVIKENTFRLLIRDTQAAWDLAFAELDKKVAKMNSVIEQMGTEPDDLHRRLTVFKAKVTKALEVISVALPDSREEIISTIYDTLEDVRQDAMQVAVFEEEIRATIANKDPGMALTVSQIPTHLPELLQDACDKTKEVLSEKIEKYDLSTRIDELAAQIRTKVDVPMFITMEEDLRIAVTLKADQKQTDLALDKKSSVVDAEKFREYITDEIDSMRAMLATSAQRAQTFQSNNTSSADFDVLSAGLNSRMDKLYKNLQETSARVGGLVPRQEIETALQALLTEVKAVRGACVDKRALEDRLQSKADNAEVDHLLSILQGTVGDPLTSQQAAIQKCLVCDKPVNPFQQATDRPNSPTTYFDKASASVPLSPVKQRPQTTSSMGRGGAHPKTAEMNILRNSMEALPALDDSRILNSAGSLLGNGNGYNSGNASRGSSRNNNLSAHSRRIRSAAGGGMGQTYQQDTR